MSFTDRRSSQGKPSSFRAVCLPRPLGRRWQNPRPSRFPLGCTDFGGLRSMSLLNHGVCLNLEIPESIALADGTTAMVRAVTAKVLNGKLDQVVYTVEKESGAWTEVPADNVSAQNE